MYFKRALFGLVFGALFGFVSGIGTVTAQSLAQATGPAELPPSGFKGRQYVDSSGCVYVRAGFDNNVTWVPRVSKTRKLICGFKPSFSGGGKVAAAQSVAKPKAVAQPKTVLQPKTVAAPKPVQPRIIKAPAQPKVIYRTVAKSPVMQQKPTKTAASPGSPWVLFPRKTRKIVAPPLAVAIAAPAPKVAPVSVRVPKGYSAAWSDDRLNPKRGRGTAQGAAQMAQVWTNEVPRKLVTATTKKRARTVRVSSKSVVPARQIAASHRYVQVGVFGQPQNVKNSVIKLRRLKLPVRMGTLTRRGKTFKIVLAGPFASQRELDYALDATRQAGFTDSILRK